MKRIRILLVVLCLLAALAACGGGSAAGETAVSEAASDGNLQFSTQESQSQGEAPGAPAVTENFAAQPSRNAKLIRRAELQVQTEAFDSAVSALESLVEEQGGYFQSARVEGGSLRNQNAERYGEYVIRLPEERFSAFLDQSGTLGYVVRRFEDSENVSQAYADTQTRLETQRTKQARLLALLEQADTMEAILELENALSDTEYEIQSLTVDLEHYDDLIDYATITLTLEEVLRLDQSPGETAGLGARLAAGAAASFRGLVQGGQELLGWLSYHLVLVAVLLAVAVGAWYGYRLRKRRKDKPNP